MQRWGGAFVLYSFSYSLTPFVSSGCQFWTPLPFSHYLRHDFHSESENVEANRVNENCWQMCITYWPFEWMLKDPKNESLSVRSRTKNMNLWVYAQGPKKWPFERMLNDPKITLWAYATGPQKRPTERMLNCCLSVRSRTKKITRLYCTSGFGTVC